MCGIIWLTMLRFTVEQADQGVTSGNGRRSERYKAGGEWGVDGMRG